MTATVDVSQAPAAPAATTPPLRHRVGPVRAMRHGLTLTWRGLVKVRHDPEMLADLTIQPIMFTLLFVYVFGGAIADSTQDYLQFALPGLIVQSAMFASMGTALGLNRDIENGIFDRFRSLPIARSAPLVGQVLGDMSRYVLSIAIMLVFGMILGFRVETNALWALAACMLVLTFILAVCWMSVLLGLVAKSPQSVQVFGFVVIVPLTFGSNVFVPADTMPGWLQAWVDVNPVSLLSSAARGLLVDGPILAPTLKTLLWSVAIVAVFAPLALRAYRRRV